MWPFKRKKRQTIGKEQGFSPVTTDELGKPVLFITPTVEMEPNFPENTHVAAKTEIAEKSLDLKSMTVVELKVLAKERGLEGYSSLNKADLINLLK